MTFNEILEDALEGAALVAEYEYDAETIGREQFTTMLRETFVRTIEGRIEAGAEMMPAEDAWETEYVMNWLRKTYPCFYAS